MQFSEVKTSKTWPRVTVALLVLFSLTLTGFGHPRVQQGAAKPRSKQQGTRSVERLIADLRHEGSDIHLEAARALGRIGDVRAIEPLITLLNDMGAHYREENHVKIVGRALAQIGKPAVEPLIANMKDKHNVRVTAIALAQFGQLVVEPLIDTMNDPNNAARLGAATALEEIPDTRAVEALLAALRKKDLAIIIAARWFFLRRHEPGSEALLEQALHKHGDIWIALDYVRSGNKNLDPIAREYLRVRGFKVVETTTEIRTSVIR